MVKEYINTTGYRIRVSEKAYRLLYKKSGFVPVEDAMSNSLASTEDAVPAGDMKEDATAQVASKANKGKTKSSASKSRKADQKELKETDRDANGQDGQEDVCTATIDQGEAEQPEGE